MGTAMTDHTADFGLRFDTPREVRALAERFMPLDRVPVASGVREDWLTRLAAWAERQPQHHRLGSWTLHR
jgi:hypothetical protein